MNFLQKLGYTALGGAISIISILTVTFLTPITADNDNFGDINCRGLTIIGKDGTKRIRLTPDGVGGRLGIFGGTEDKREIAGIYAHEYGSGVHLGRINGISTNSFSVDDNGGKLILSSNLTGKTDISKFEVIELNFEGEHGAQISVKNNMNPAIQMGSGEHGGFITVAGKMRNNVALGSAARGGFLAILSHEGKSTVQMHADNTAAGISLRNNGGRHMIDLIAFESGGDIQVMNEDEQSVVKISIFENRGSLAIYDHLGKAQLGLGSADGVGGGVLFYDDNGLIDVLNGRQLKR